MAQITSHLDRQLEADFCVPAGEIARARALGQSLIVRPRLDLEHMPAWRRRHSSHWELRLAHYGGITLVSAAHPGVLAAVSNLLAGDRGSWIGDYSKLRALNDFLSPFPLQSSGTANYYTPSAALLSGQRLLKAPKGYVFMELSAPVIETFRGDNRFSNALGFSPLRPDVLVLAAYRAGEPVAMAGASEDSDLLRQIGIDVLSEHRGQGLASYLTQQLALRVLHQGLVPYYGTSASHILSQRVAWGAGLLPSWYEFTSSSLLDIAPAQKS